MRRTLLGFADTEGGCGNKLWNFSAIFTRVVQGQDMMQVAEEQVFSSLSYTFSKATGCRKSLRAFRGELECLRRLHRCDAVCLMFWNAPHDVKVLSEHLGKELPFETVDLLAVARKEQPWLESFKLWSACEEHGLLEQLLLVNAKRHTAFGDALALSRLYESMLQEPKAKPKSPMQICIERAERLKLR